MIVDTEGYLQYLAGTFIQTALPQLSADQREQLLTGTHPKCWKEMFPDE